MGEFFLGHFAIGVLIHAGKTTFDVLAGKGGIFFFVHTAVCIAVHFLEEFFSVGHSSGAARASWATKATTSTLTALSRRASLGATAFRASFWGSAFRATTFWGTTEAATFRCALSRATSATFTFSTATATHAAELFADLLDLCCIDEAIRVAINAAESLFELTALALDEFFLADFAIGIGIGFLHELFDAAGTIAAWGALSFLRLGGDHGCAGKSEAINECLFGFHSVE